MEALQDVPELSEVPESLAVPDEQPERALAVPALQDAAVQERESQAFRLPEAWAVTADAAVRKPASSFLLEESAQQDAATALSVTAVWPLASIDSVFVS